jgi:3-methyladenine DNA glycosylase AlkD
MAKTPAAAAILKELKPLGKESYKRILMQNHGVQEPCFGVAISELKKIQKRIKKDYQLALDLYDTGNYDAMYLAGLIADDAKMTRADLERWVKKARGGSLPGATVPWVASGSPHGWEKALEWIESTDPTIALAGWTTLASFVSIKEDDELDLKALQKLGKRVEKEIHQAPDLVRYAMNGFLISLGSYVKSMTAPILKTAERIGPVMADLGNNSCQIPFAPDYIRKVEARGSIGKKRKSAKC